MVWQEMTKISLHNGTIKKLLLPYGISSSACKISSIVLSSLFDTFAFVPLVQLTHLKERDIYIHGLLILLLSNVALSPYAILTILFSNVIWRSIVQLAHMLKLFKVATILHTHGFWELCS